MSRGWMPWVLLAVPLVSCVPRQGRMSTRSGDPWEPAEYVGLHFTDLPDGLQKSEGALIWFTRVTDPTYALELVVKDGVRMVWFERAVGEAGGETVWEVLDVLELPSMADDERFVLTGCGLSENQLDDGMMGIARYEPRARLLRDVRLAWRANLEVRRIESIPANGVVCYNEGWNV